MINPAKSYTADEYVEIIRRRIWYIIIPFILIFAAAFAYTYVAPKQYKATTLVLVSPQRVPEAFVQATVTSRVEERLQSIAQEVMSRTRLEQIMTEYRLYEKERKSMPREAVFALMQKNIQVALPTRKDEAKGHFTITYTGDDPNVVTTVTNRLASLFIEENLKIREQQAVGTTEFLTNELTSAKTKLDQMETAVTQYKRRYMGELPEQRDTNIKILEQLQNQYQRVGESIRSAQDRKLFIQKQLSDMETPGGAGSLGSATYGKDIRTTPGKTSYLDMTPSSRPGETGGGYYESQREALTKTLDELTAKYTSSHPDVIATKKKLAELKNKKDKDPELYDIKKDPRYRELQNQLTLTDMEIKRLSEEERGLVAQMNRYRGRIELTPAREQDMASLMREYESTKATYETLLKKSQEAQQAENLEKRQKGEQFRVIDPARVPEKPFSPDIPKILLIGLAAGLGCGFGLAFLREQMDRSFHEPGDAEIALGLKVLATIPKIEEMTA